MTLIEVATDYFSMVKMADGRVYTLFVTDFDKCNLQFRHLFLSFFQAVAILRTLQIRKLILSFARVQGDLMECKLLCQL